MGLHTMYIITSISVYIHNSILYHVTYMSYICHDYLIYYINGYLHV